MSDFQFFSFPARIGVVKIWRRPITVLTTGTTQRPSSVTSGALLCCPQWLTLDRFRPPLAAALGRPPPPTRGGSVADSVEFQSPERHNSLSVFGNAAKYAQILHRFAREGSGLFQSRGSIWRTTRKGVNDLQLSCAKNDCSCHC
jgi:hypothetical protein